MLPPQTHPTISVKRHPSASADLARHGCVDRSTARVGDVLLTTDILRQWEALKVAGTSVPTGEWSWIFAHYHSEYEDVLNHGDNDRLCALLRTCFRNNLTAGLVSQCVCDDSTPDNACFDFANNLLLDFDTWTELCDSNRSILDVPTVGNPYGLTIGNAVIMPDTPRHDYHAKRLASLLNVRHRDGKRTILEIGGGYGGACLQFLRRSSSPICWINVDLEQNLFVSYFFIASCIKLLEVPVRVRWGGLPALTRDLVEQSQNSEVWLIPARNHHLIECGSDIAYNSTSFSEMSRTSIERTCKRLPRMGLSSSIIRTAPFVRGHSRREVTRRSWQRNFQSIKPSTKRCAEL